MFDDREQKPETMGATSFIFALGFHVLLFLALYAIGQLAFRQKEVVIPIDLTVVVQENLDGVEDEPPPLEPPRPDPPPPPPPPPQPKTPEPPPPRPDPPAVEHVNVKTNVVAVTDKKKTQPPKEEPKQEPKKKTAAELREERLKAMRANAKDVPKTKTPPPPPRNGRTGPKTLSDEEIARLMNAGYRAGATEQIAPNEESMCLSFLNRAIDDKWRQLSPAIGRAGTVIIRIRFDRAGRIASSALATSCGDATSDKAALHVVQSVGVVRGLTSKFIEKYSREDILVRYKIENLK